MSAVNETTDLLKNLVLYYEENERELVDVPKEIADKFGYFCLSNSLLYKEPKLPQYDKETIPKYIQTHSFPTVKSLCEYIMTFKKDIDKLYAIYCWCAFNIQYDVKSYFSHNIHGTTLEKVFKTKCAVCDGYSLFFYEMAKRVKINTDRIIIKRYSNDAKGYGYDQLNPKSYPSSNHSSIYIEIDGAKYICEPTWGSGHVGCDHKFYPHFNPNSFLIPLYRSINDHYPCDEFSKCLPFEIPYKDYIKAMQIHSHADDIKLESNPFAKIDCANGYLEQIYSCEGPINSLCFTLYIKKNKEFQKIPNESIIGYEILQTKLARHPNRCRFRVNIAFPQKGLYQIVMFLNSHYTLDYYVNSLSKSSVSIPILCNPNNEEGFLPILPKRMITEVKSNYTLIRFAVAKNKSSILYNLKKYNDPNSFDSEKQKVSTKDCSEVTLKIPFDESRYENIVFIKFPSNGRFSVDIFLKNDHGTYDYYMTYYFNVTGANNNNNLEEKTIVNYIYKGRQFSDKKFYDDEKNEIAVFPSSSCNLITDDTQTIEILTKSKDDSILLNLRKDGETFFPKKIKDSSNGARIYQILFSKGYGEYYLLGWVNDSYSIEIKYIYQEQFPSPPKEEKIIMNELKMTIQNKIHFSMRNDQQINRIEELFKQRDNAIKMENENKKVKSETNVTKNDDNNNDNKKEDQKVSDLKNNHSNIKKDDNNTNKNKTDIKEVNKVKDQKVENTIINDKKADENINVVKPNITRNNIINNDIKKEDNIKVKRIVVKKENNNNYQNDFDRFKAQKRIELNKFQRKNDTNWRPPLKMVQNYNKPNKCVYENRNQKNPINIKVPRIRTSSVKPKYKK